MHPRTDCYMDGFGNTKCGYHQKNFSGPLMILHMEGTVKIDILKCGLQSGNAEKISPRSSARRCIYSIQVFCQQEEPWWNWLKGSFNILSIEIPKGEACQHLQNPKRETSVYSRCLPLWNFEAIQISIPYSQIYSPRIISYRL